MPQIIPLLTLTLVQTWYEESTLVDCLVCTMKKGTKNFEVKVDVQTGP
jgi:hypothetical protein